MSRRLPRRPYGCNPHVRHDDPEPSIRELLADPVLGLLMKLDGVSRARRLDIVDRARARLGHDEIPAFEATLFAECRV